MALRRLNVIAAIDSNGGIGKNDGLPWKLREDMKFFSKITSAATGGRCNAVILGRKTWESIPPKFKPLKNRVNIVVSKTMDTAPEGVHIAKSFENSLQIVDSLKIAKQVDEVFVIGGAGLYKEAMSQTSYPIRFYCTHVMKDFQCDVFFPEIDWNKLKLVDLQSVDTQVIHCDGVDIRFAVYESQ